MGYFIRIGEIPDNERSGIYRGDSKIGEEDGVSVYNAVPIKGKDGTEHWSIVLPSPLTETLMSDLRIFYDMIYCDAYETPPIYIVEGDVVSFGSTNEPLIRNVKIKTRLDKI